jgi:LPPG:FO 2-phospho-L-lactate transferase
MIANEGHVVALAGGVGGAKLAHGLALTGLNERLSVIVNTADDFELFGLHISPYLDTVLYTLGGIANSETGWGIAGDTFATLKAIERLGRETWFWLGDQDFATHILRTERLRDGVSITAVTAELANALKVRAALLPMCDEPVATMIETSAGLLDFQSYFVRRQHADPVLSVQFSGIEQAVPSMETRQALEQASVIVLCPSNPIVSIGPILALPEVHACLCETEVPVVAVSPIIAGQALKGPADQMLASLGHEVSAAGVAAVLADVIDGLLIDDADAALAERIAASGVRVRVAQTIMRSDADRAQLARETLAFAAELAR